MSPIIIPPPVVPNDLESHILDGVELADGVIFDLADAPAVTHAPARQDMIGSVDSDGSVPLDEGHHDNSTLVLPLRVVKQTTADNAWNKLGVILDKIQAMRRSPNGMSYIWAPKGMTDSWELTVRAAAITELPMASRGDQIGYLLRAPRFTLVLTCDPFMYRVGESIEYTEVTSTAPVFSILLDDVPGHADAEATVTVTDDASQSRRHVEWGLAENSAAPLLIDSASLDITVGEFAATATTRTGAYASNGVVRATLATQTQAICGTGALGHIGVLRPKARVWASSMDVRLRLAYRTADNPYSYTPWIPPIVEDDFSEVAFGVIAISAVTDGAQEWDGRIEAYSATSGDTLDVDYFMPLPADRWGKARAAYLYQAGLITALDEFTGIAVTTGLNGRALPIGGSTWTTSGPGADFTARDAPGASETVGRSFSGSGDLKYAIQGSSVTNTETRVEVQASAFGTGTAAMFAVARYVDANNHLTLKLTNAGDLFFVATVGGSEVAVRTRSGVPGWQVGAWHALQIVAFESGFAVGRMTSANGQVLADLRMTDAALATGGALATGKTGFGDLADVIVSVTRYYDNFSAATPPAEAFACYAGRSIEFRHDACERESADGTTWGKPKSYTGGRVYVPASGDEARETRLWVKARRNDIDVSADSAIADSTTLSVALRGRYLLPASP